MAMDLVKSWAMMLDGPPQEELTEEERQEALRKEHARRVNRQYVNRPDIKAKRNTRRRERLQKDPELRKRARDRQREYESRPEVMAARNAKKRKLRLLKKMQQQKESPK